MQEFRDIPLLLVLSLSLCLHALAETSESPRAGDQAKKGKRKGRNKQETPAYVEPSTHVEEVKTPLDLAKVRVSGTRVLTAWLCVMVAVSVLPLHLKLNAGLSRQYSLSVYRALFLPIIFLGMVRVKF